MRNSVRTSGRALAAFALGALALAGAAQAHPFHSGADTPVTQSEQFGGLVLDRVDGAYDYPVFVASPRGDASRTFVVEQDGQIQLIKDGVRVARPFLDLKGQVGFNAGERGLLSMAFAPDYATSGLFYVFYTENDGDLRVDEFRRSPADDDVATRVGRRKVIAIAHKVDSIHNGGQLRYRAPNRLYISTGDGGGRGDPLRTGQRLDTLLGKILRIDPRTPSDGRGYSIPAGNPFVGREGRDEIWAYGLRNPWRFSFDRATGDMVIGDVGQGTMEEVDLIRDGRRGVNFGWSCFEGTLVFRADCTAPGHVPPVLTYTHSADDSNASCSVTGGVVLRDRAVPSLYGRYVYGDYCTGALHGALLREGVTTPEQDNAVLDLIVPRLTGFGEDGRGRLYATSRAYGTRPGAVYRLRARP